VNTVPEALSVEVATRDEVDPELALLPDPPRRERTFTVAILLLAAASAVALTVALGTDVAYALCRAIPIGLGDLRTAPAAVLAASENRFVRADAMLGAAGGIRYERPFVADSFRTMPVAGRTDLWVDLRVPAGQESGRWEPPRAVAGRLVRIGAGGPRHRGVASAIADVTHENVPTPAWLLVDGEEPAGARWAIVLAAALLAFAAWNVTAAVRLVRRVK
jgi:hypothetical protein